MPVRVLLAWWQSRSGDQRDRFAGVAVHRALPRPQRQSPGDGDLSRSTRSAPSSGCRYRAGLGEPGAHSCRTRHHGGRSRRAAAGSARRCPEPREPDPARAPGPPGKGAAAQGRRLPCAARARAASSRLDLPPIQPRRCASPMSRPGSSKPATACRCSTTCCGIDSLQTPPSCRPRPTSAACLATLRTALRAINAEFALAPPGVDHE